MSHNYIIRKTKLHIDQHPLNGKVVDILIEDGKIKAIEPEINSTNQEFIANNTITTVGWFDVFTQCNFPGEPLKEDFESLTASAQMGGFTQIAALCGTHPLPETAAAIAGIRTSGKKLHAEILPLGVSSEHREGKEMAEVNEMFQAGSIAHTDGIKGSASLSLRTKLMQYCHSLNIPYAHFPFESKLVTGATIHEGTVSVNLGLKGLPAASETIAIINDLMLAEWLNCPVRILGVSSAASVAIIRKAKKDGFKIFAAVPILNLKYTDQSLNEFDSNFKVLPPLRTENDRLALIEGVLDGTIDAIMSNHCPEDIESKKLEFDYANFGAATYPAFLSIFMDVLGDNWMKAINSVTNGPRQFYNLPLVKADLGSIANLTIIDPNETIQLTDSNKKTKAYNAIGLNETLKGKVRATVVNGELKTTN